MTLDEIAEETSLKTYAVDIKSVFPAPRLYISSGGNYILSVSLKVPNRVRVHPLCVWLLLGLID